MDTALICPGCRGPTDSDPHPAHPGRPCGVVYTEFGIPFCGHSLTEASSVPTGIFRPDLGPPLAFATARNLDDPAEEPGRIGFVEVPHWLAPESYEPRPESPRPSLAERLWADLDRLLGRHRPPVAPAPQEEAP